MSNSAASVAAPSPHFLLRLPYAIIESILMELDGQGLHSIAVLCEDWGVLGDVVYNIISTSPTLVRRLLEFMSD